MKNMKRVFALLMVMVMVLGMGSVAFAAGGEPSITINPNNEAGDTSSLAIDYTYYKIMSASIDTDPVVGTDGATTTAGVAAYYVEDEDQATALTGTGLFNVTKVDGQAKWFVELKDADTSADQIVQAFDNETFLAKFTKQTYTKEAGATSAVLPDITAGYYFIKSSLGTKAAVQTLSPVTINEKNSYPTIAKDYSTAATDKDGMAAIGDVIPYTITVVIPDSVEEKEIKIVDTITNGLTLDTAVTVGGAVEDPEYTSATFAQTSTVAATETTKAATVYTLTIPKATVIANKGQTLTFTYSATVNTNAVVLENESNKAHLEYDKYVTKDTEPVTTKTLAIDIQKVDGTDKTTVLAGAKFKLYDAATAGNEIKVVLKTAASDANGNVNVYRVATATETGVEIEAGTARIEGLNNLTYYLEETDPPTGYNKLDARAGAAASEETSPAAAVDYKIENNKGTTLPSTGGMGTTIFYVVGAILVIGAAVLLISKRRMNDR